MDKDPDYLSFVRSMPCCNCGAEPPSDAHHVRFLHGGGTGMKPTDLMCAALCRRCHNLWHQKGHFLGMDRTRSENVLLREMVKRLAQWHSTF